MKPILMMTAMSFISVSQANAQSDPTAICAQILPEAGRNISLTKNSSVVLNSVFDNYCDSSGTAQNSSSDLGLSAVVASIPVGLSVHPRRC
jgi:hypothetical protein